MRTFIERIFVSLIEVVSFEGFKMQNDSHIKISNIAKNIKTDAQEEIQWKVIIFFVIIIDSSLRNLVFSNLLAITRLFAMLLTRQEYFSRISVPENSIQLAAIYNNILCSLIFIY